MATGQKVKPKPKPLIITIGQPGPTMKLKIRKTMDGQIMVMDHNDIDIVVMPSTRKVIAFPKTSYQDNVYACQDRFFRFLTDQGVLKRDSIQGGNVYGAMEALYPGAVEGIDPDQMIVFAIGKWIEEERPHMKREEAYEEKWENDLVNPNEDDSTSLGEIGHSAKKGSIDPRKIRSYLSSMSPY